MPDAWFVPSGSANKPQIVNAIEICRTSCAFTKPHTRPAAIFIDEFHPGLFEGLVDDGIVSSRERGRHAMSSARLMVL